MLTVHMIAAVSDCWPEYEHLIWHWANQIDALLVAGGGLPAPARESQDEQDHE
jgi:hypothetical protein